DLSESKLVRDRHFPTFVDVPNPPGKRSVVPGGTAARARAQQEASRMVSPKFSEEQRASLGAFGQSLHPLQDSWSHQGTPDIPFKDWSPLPSPCDPNLAWAHPPSRGGWHSHDADKSHRWPA